MKKPKEIKKILDDARTSGSVHLSGTREERLQQLRTLRANDIANEYIKRGDSGTDTEITGNTSKERETSLRKIITNQRKIITNNKKITTNQRKKTGK